MTIPTTTEGTAEDADDVADGVGDGVGDADSVSVSDDVGDTSVTAQTRLDPESVCKGNMAHSAQ